MPQGSISQSSAPQGSIPQGLPFKYFSTWVPTDCSSPSPPALLWAALNRLQLWPELLLWEYPWAVSSFRTHPLLPHGLLHGYTGRSAPCGDHGLQGDGLLLHGPLLGCRELPLCTWNTSCPPSALTWMAAGRFSHVSHSSLPAAVVQQFFHFLSLLSEHTQHHSWLSSGSSVSLWSSWSWLFSDTGQRWALLTEATPAAPLPKPYHINPIH